MEQPSPPPRREVPMPRLSARRFAVRLAERLDEVLPDGLAATAGGARIRLHADVRVFGGARGDRLYGVLLDGLDAADAGESVRLDADWRVFGGASVDWVGDELEPGETPEERAAMVAGSVLNGLQDEVAYELTRWWPEDPSGQMPFPTAEVVDGRLRMVFERNDGTVVLRLRDLDVAEVVDA